MSEDVTDPNATPVRPRHAASLIIHREGPSGTEVFMGRRPKKSRFKPDVYVFPGGAIERADYRVSPSSPLASDIAPKLAVAQSTRRAQALALAAVRETFEETGLMLNGSGSLGAGLGSSWGEFASCNQAPDLSLLSYLGRAITPSFQPIRFHARFFYTHADNFGGTITHSPELEDLRWVPLHSRDGLNMMLVTELMLETLERRLSGEIETAPFLSFRYGRRFTRWE